MFNVTVVKLKDIFRYLFIFFIIYAVLNFFVKNKDFKNFINISIISYSDDFLKFGINVESDIINQLSNNNSDIDQTEEVENRDFLTIESIIKMGTNIFNVKVRNKNNNVEIEQTINENKDDESNVELTEASSNVESEVVTKNPITESYNIEYKGIKIKNESSYDLNDDILNLDNLNIDSKKILIFHTHTCESYTQTDDCKYEESRKF